jgi:sulfonate transport system substrate-binding protein
MPSLLASISRRHLLQSGTVLAGAAAIGSSIRTAAADPVKIRFATGGGVGPNEMETIIFLDHLKQNVLTNYGKAYVIDMTFTRGSPEAATLLASGQADMAVLASGPFATAVNKGAVTGGMTIVADSYQDGHAGRASNSFVVLEDSPIKTIADLKGKKIAINAFGSAVDVVLRVALKKAGMDPRRDVQIVEVAFPNIGAAVREKRVDCGCLVIPFLPAETAKGGLRTVFTGGDAMGPASVIFQVARTEFLKSNQAAVRAYLADYVQGLAWYNDPANRTKAIEVIAEYLKSPKEVLDSYFASPRDYFRDPGGCVAPAMIQKPIDAMAEEKLIEPRIDVSKFVDLSYLPKPCAI